MTMVEDMLEKGLQKLISIFGTESVEEILENISIVNELLYGEDDELTLHLPFEGKEIQNAEDKISKHISNKMQFEEDYEETEFVDICRRLVKTYESNELLETKLFLKILSGISGFDIAKYFT